MDPPDVLPEKEVFDLPLHLLVQDQPIAVEHPDVGRAAVQRRHLDVHAAGDLGAAGIVLGHRDGQLAEILDRGAPRHHAGHQRPVDHAGGTLDISGGSDLRAFGKQGGERGAQPGAVLRRQLDVHQADEAGRGEQAALPRAGPDNTLVHGRAGLDVLVGPDLDASLDGAALAYRDVVANHGALLEQAIVLDLGVAADDGLPQAGILANVGVVPDDRVADLGAVVDHRILAHANGAIDEGPRLDLGFLSQVGRADDPDVVTKLHVLSHPHVALAAFALDLDVHRPGQRIPVRLVVGLDVADVAPIAGSQVAVERQGVAQHPGEDVATPIDHGGGRQQVQHPGIQYVDPGVHLV